MAYETPNLASRLAPVESLTVDVLSDNVSDTYVSKTPFARSEMENVIEAGAPEISGTALLVATLGYGLRLRSVTASAEHVLLFDTGTEGAAFLRNCRNVGVDLGEVEEIAITHGHWDHMGALIDAVDAIVAGRGEVTEEGGLHVGKHGEFTLAIVADTGIKHDAPGRGAHHEALKGNDHAAIGRGVVRQQPRVGLDGGRRGLGQQHADVVFPGMYLDETRHFDVADLPGTQMFDGHSALLVWSTRWIFRGRR